MWIYSYNFTDCSVSVSRVNATILTLYHVMVVWSFIAFLSDSPTVSDWYQKQIRIRLDNLSVEHLRYKKRHNKQSKQLAEQETLLVV